ncbi:MAG: hypothetical protein QOH39_1609 [Verrucomicrobiota bacterium]|jgi:hypothetical protein
MDEISSETAEDLRRKNLPILREAIDKEVDELLKLLCVYDPLELIARYARHHLVANVDQPQDDSRSESRVEYLISLAISQELPPDPLYPSPDEIQRCFDLVDSIFISATLYHGFDKIGRGDPLDAQTDLAAQLQLNALHVRGDSFYHHMRKRFEDVIGQHNDFFKDKIGFCIGDFHRLIDSVEKQMNDRLEQDQYTNVRPLQQLMACIANESKLSVEQIASGAAEPTQLAAIKEKYRLQIAEAKALFDRAAPADIFRIEPSSETEANILFALSCSFGDNAEFLTKVRKFKGWPLNPTVFSTKPIIGARGAFYIFHLQFLGRSAFRLFEQLARERDLEYCRHKYLNSRDKYVETEALNLISHALSGCKTYNRLRYEATTGDCPYEAELDGLVLFDDNCLIVEAKAHGLSAAARRGAPSFVEDVALSIGDSYKQAIRLNRELETRGSVTLFDNNRNFVVRLDKSQFQKIFFVSVTFEALPIVATKLPSLKQLGLIPGREWPWSVCLDDLRVVVEILDRPSLFLHYLIRRVRLNDFPKVHASDELDYLMNYVYQGLFFETDPNYEKFDELTLADHTQELSRYYQRLQGWADSGKKPRVRLSSRVRRFLDMLEIRRPRHFSTAALALLDYDGEGRDELLKQLPAQLDRLRKADRILFASVSCKNDALALFICIVHDVKGARLWAVERCKTDLLPKYGLTRAVLVIFEPPIGGGVVEVKLIDA